MFRRSGRGIDDVGEIYLDQFVALNPIWEDAAFWTELAGSPDWLAERRAAISAGVRRGGSCRCSRGARPSPPSCRKRRPSTATSRGPCRPRAATIPPTEEPWAPVYLALHRDLSAIEPAALQAYGGSGAAELRAAVNAVAGFERTSVQSMFEDIHRDWLDPEIWSTIKVFSPPYTPGYFLSSVDLKLTPEGVVQESEGQRIYLFLFQRTLFMSLVIMISCVLLGGGGLSGRLSARLAAGAHGEPAADPGAAAVLDLGSLGAHPRLEGAPFSSQGVYQRHPRLGRHHRRRQPADHDQQPSSAPSWR